MCCCAVLLLLLLLFVAVTVSQPSITVDKNNVKDGESVVFTCTVDNFNDDISVMQEGTSRAFCFSSSPCTPTDNTLYTAVKSGTTDVIFTILSFLKARDVGSWIVRYGTSTDSNPITLAAFIDSPVLQTSTSLATERTTSVNNIFEYNNITTSMTPDGITSTRDISISTISYLNTATSNLNANIESSSPYTNTDFYANTDTEHSYAKIETANLKDNIESTNVYANNESTNFLANTEINKIQTDISRVISNTMSIYQSIFVTTVSNDISGSLFPNTKSKKRTEMFASPSYSVSSEYEITLPPAFETNHFLSQICSETSCSYSMDTQTDNLLHNFNFSSASPITTDSFRYHILSMPISPSHVADLYTATFSTVFSVPNLATDTSDSAFEIPNVSRVSSFLLITETVNTLATSSTVNSSAVNTVLNSEISENLFLSLSVNRSNFQQIFTSKESQWMSTTSDFDKISYASDMIDPSFSSYQNASETTVILPNYSESRQLPLSIIDTMHHFIYTTNTLITSYMDDTSHSFGDFTGGFQTFSQDYTASASTSFLLFFQSTDYNLLFQTTEYHATMQPDFTSYVNTSCYESLTDNAATRIYSKEIMTAGKSYMPTSVMPSQTQLASMNGIQDSTTVFHSTNIESYFQSTAEDFSSEISEYLLSTLQSTSLLLPFDTKANASKVDLKTTNLSTFESLSGILTMDESLFTNPSSILISNVLPDFKTLSLTTTIYLNSKTMPSMINPSSQQTDSDNSYIKIDTSFIDSFSFGSFSGSLSSNYPVMTSLSSGVFKSISTLSTNTVQSGLAEKNKKIIFISTISAILIIITVILSIIIAKVYMSKNNNSSPPEPASPDYSFTGKIIYPLLNTSTTSLKMHPYEHNWNDIV